MGNQEGTVEKMGLAFGPKRWTFIEAMKKGLTMSSWKAGNIPSFISRFPVPGQYLPLPNIC